METSTTFFINQLKSKGIRPSFQRLKVLEYLNQNGGHPTTEDIYSALSPVIPSLSRTTIYNTLHIFVEAGLIRVIEIDEAQMRYDINLDDHGHFLCVACGMIYNFPVSNDANLIEGLHQFKIMQKNIYLKGLCPNCIEN